MIFLLGIATFGVGSILVGVASGVGAILVGRVIQGVGAALFVLLGAISSLLIPTPPRKDDREAVPDVG